MSLPSNNNQSPKYYIVVPTPISVTLSPPYPGIIRPVGSAVTMTCTVELSPVVNVPVTVVTEWTGSAGFAVNVTAQPIEGSTMHELHQHSSGRFP